MDFLDFLEEKENFAPLPPLTKRQRSVDFVSDAAESETSRFRVERDQGQPSSNFSISPDVSEKLYPYQRDGVQWLYERHCGGCGCVLADEMGLGKTVQISSFIGSLMRGNAIKTVLIVVPGTLLDPWADALVQWGGLPSACIEVLHKGAKSARVKRWQRFRHGTAFVAITTYGIMKSDSDELGKITVDYVVLDEAHLIKDPSSESFKSAKNLKAIHRIAVTGTPLMNNYNELWALMNFADENILKCSRSDFSAVNLDIVRGNEKDATANERGVAVKAIDSFRSKIATFMLRREKNILGIVPGKKTEYVVWVRMASAQSEQYRAFLESDVVKVALRSINTSQPLVLLTALKRICDHPWLNFNEQNFLEAMSQPDTLPKEFHDFGTIESGPKLRIAVRMIKSHHSDNQRTLVFSRSKRLLHMLAFLLKKEGLSYVRFDGDTAISERSNAIKKFNEGDSAACLATTQVGGVGVTFTGASRVILLDPSWNPAADAQAVDRVHRIGQREDVLVYRLVSSGTVDENVYRNQVFKMMAARQVSATSLESANALHRYFTHTQLRNMFELHTDETTCETAVQLREVHPDSVPQCVLDALRSTLGDDMLDVSSHSAMFTKTEASDQAPTARVKKSRAPRKRTPTPPPSSAVDEATKRETDELLLTVRADHPSCESQTAQQPMALEFTAPVIEVQPKPRCTIFAPGNAGAIGIQDCADALVMVRGIKFARIHMSEVHRGSIALDINDYMLDSDEDDSQNEALLTAEDFFVAEPSIDWLARTDSGEREASNPEDSGKVSLVEDFQE